MKPIIKVESLSKKFRITPGEAPSVRYETLRESLVKIVRAPFGNRRNGNNETIWALKEVSFDVLPGEVLGIIGRNGAGKSTLLKVLSRIIEPTSGRVELYGRIASLIEVGTGFHPDLSGRENVYLNGAILGMKHREIDQRFDEIVAFAEVERFIDTAVKHYSSGMYLRLAFAVAAHLDPEILIVDEVLAVGDASFQKKCFGKMDAVTQSGRTVLLVSHSLGVITKHCQRAILLDGGRIVKAGPAQEVVAHYEAMVNLQAEL
jgi:lipopolysaccharide transport system ATP-binding protein